MRLFPIISVAMRVVVMANPVFDTDSNMESSMDMDFSSDFSADFTTFDAPKVKEETKTGKIQPTIRPRNVST